MGWPLLDDLLARTPALQDGGVLDLDVVLGEAEVSCVVRVVCVPTGGEDRYYLTNLPRSHFSPCDVAEIYSARWEIELLYKDWQGGCRLDEVTRLSNLHTLRAVIYGGLLAHLLSRELARKANDDANDTAARPDEDEGTEGAADDVKIPVATAGAAADGTPSYPREACAPSPLHPPAPSTAPPDAAPSAPCLRDDTSPPSTSTASAAEDISP